MSDEAAIKVPGITDQQVRNLLSNLVLDSIEDRIGKEEKIHQLFDVAEKLDKAGNDADRDFVIFGMGNEDDGAMLRLKAALARLLAKQLARDTLVGSF